MNQNILEYMAAYYNMQEGPPEWFNKNNKFKCVILSNDACFVNKIATERAWVKIYEDAYSVIWEEGQYLWKWRPQGWGERTVMGQRFIKIIADKEIDKEMFCNFFSIANLNWCNSMEVLP